MSSLCSLLHQHSQKKKPEKKDYVFKKQLRRKMLIVNQNLYLRLLCQVAVVLLQNSLLCRDGQRMWCERGKRNQTSPSSVPRTAILNQTGWDRNQSGKWLRTELQGLEPQVHVGCLQRLLSMRAPAKGLNPEKEKQWPLLHNVSGVLYPATQCGN